MRAEMLAETGGELDFLQRSGALQRRANLVLRRGVVDGGNIIESSGGLWREVGGDEGLPGGGLFIVRIDATDPNDEAEGGEERSGPGIVVGEGLGLLVRQSVRIGTEGGVLGA